jgi:hypothetical protein
MIAVGIIGNGETTLNNAADLLNDYLAADAYMYVPSYITSDGLKVVVQWLKEQEYPVERVKRHLLSSYLSGDPTRSSILITLGIQGSEDVILECMEDNIPVLDLTRGLYRVSKDEIASDGSVSEPKTVSGDSGTSVPPTKDLVLESLTEPQIGDDRETVERWILDKIKQLDKEVKTLTGIVKSNETNWEPSPVPESIQEQINAEVDSDRTDTTRYYVNGKGKHRKAGRSKIKSGEREVWLTEDEIESLTS